MCTQLQGGWESEMLQRQQSGFFFFFIMHPVKVWLPHAMLLVKLGLIWHSECNLMPKAWTSWYTYLIVYMTRLLYEFYVNMSLIQKCSKSWSVWEEMGNRTPTPPWCWQKSHTGHLRILNHMPSLCCLTSQWVFIAGLLGRKQDRLMTSQAKVWKDLELSWGHNRKVTERDHWWGHYHRWPVLSLLYSSSCYSVSVMYSKVRPILV